MALAKVGRKLKRTGKDAYKFQFTATCEQLSLQLKPEVTKWSPYKILVSFSRSHRKVETSTVFFKSVVESGQEGDASWNPPSELQLLVTLYRAPDATKFDEKEYKFEILNISKDGDEKCLAVFYCDMAQYVKEDDESKSVLSMTFKPSSKKIAVATLDLTIQSKLVKKGKAGDEDMMSTASRVSQSDLRDLDEDLDEADRGAPAKSKVSKSEDKKMKKSLQHMAAEDGNDPATKKSTVADWLGVAPGAGSSDVDAMLQADSRFADAVLVDREGASLPVSRLLGVAVVGVYFSAEWCPPCREFMPVLKKFYDMLKEKGASFELLWVSSDKNAQTMLRYAQSMEMSWPMLEYDHPLGTELRDSFEINSIPTLCIVDAVGNKIDHHGRAAVEKAVETNTAWSSYNLWLSKVSSSAMHVNAKPLTSQTNGQANGVKPQGEDVALPVWASSVVERSRSPPPPGAEDAAGHVDGQGKEEKPADKDLEVCPLTTANAPETLPSESLTSEDLKRQSVADGGVPLAGQSFDSMGANAGTGATLAQIAANEIIEEKKDAPEGKVEVHGSEEQPSADDTQVKTTLDTTSADAAAVSSVPETTQSSDGSSPTEAASTTAQAPEPTLATKAPEQTQAEPVVESLTAPSPTCTTSDAGVQVCIIAEKPTASEPTLAEKAVSAVPVVAESSVQASIPLKEPVAAVEKAVNAVPEVAESSVQVSVLPKEPPEAVEKAVNAVPVVAESSVQVTLLPKESPPAVEKAVSAVPEVTESAVQATSPPQESSPTSPASTQEPSQQVAEKPDGVSQGSSPPAPAVAAGVVAAVVAGQVEGAVKTAAQQQHSSPGDQEDDETDDEDYTDSEGSDESYYTDESTSEDDGIEVTNGDAKAAPAEATPAEAVAEAASAEENPESQKKAGLLQGVKKLVKGKRGRAATKAPSADEADGHGEEEEPKMSKKLSVDDTGAEQPKSPTAKASKEKEKKGLMDRLKAKDLQIEGLQDERRVLSEENDRLKEENLSLTERVDELQLIVQDLRQQMEVVEAEKMKLQKRIMEQNVQLTLKGWLSKRGVVGPTKNVWRRRYFELAEGGLLHYFTESDEVNPRGTIDLNLMTGVQEHTPDQQSDATMACFKVVTQSRTFELMARDRDTMTKWINALDSYHTSLKRS